MDNKTSISADFFVAGGTLALDTPSYVTRPADEELLDLALAGQFCYVLTPRQMGKSSLMSRTNERLNTLGVKTAIIDVTAIGPVTVEQWYLSLLTRFQRQLDLTIDPDDWWQARAFLGPVQRFTDFLRDVILTEIKTESVVIFIDEIDATLKFEFRDAFFAAIRAMYNARPNDPELNRLTFILFGVASPSDLIKDRALTPFNIGQGITLNEFTREEAGILQKGLETVYPKQASAIFKRIYYWTNGYPYLAQKLCLAIAQSNRTDWTNPDIDALVDKLFLSEAARKDSNLQFVQDKTLSHSNRRQLLNLYKKVYQGAKIANDGQSVVQNQLKLSGLLKEESGYLHVRNEIYRHVFDFAWAKENTKINWIPIVAGVAVTVAFFAIGLIVQNAWVGIQAQTATNHFYEAPSPAGQVAPLAKLFRLQSFVPPTEYDYKAQELFISLSSSDQLALFQVQDVNHSDLIMVIKGLYVTLADIENNNSTRPLLEAMVNALNRFEQTAETIILQDEMNHWLEARAFSSQNQNDEALSEYDQAFALNNENPAILYERGQILTKLERYPQALNDFDRIVAIANRTLASQPTSSPTPLPTMTLYSTPSPLLVDMKFTSTINPTMTPNPPSTPSVVILSDQTATVDMILSPTMIPTVTPQPTPTRAPIGSNFDTPGKMIGEVRKFIQNVPELMDNLMEAPPSEHTNLRDIIPSTPTPTPTASSTPRASATSTLDLSLGPTLTATLLVTLTSSPVSTRTTTVTPNATPESPTTITSETQTAVSTESPTITLETQTSPPTESPTITPETQTSLLTESVTRTVILQASTRSTNSPVVPNNITTPPPWLTFIPSTITIILSNATSTLPVPPIPPSATLIPPTAPPILPTSLPILPTVTPVSPTLTPVLPTLTPVLPTLTPILPTVTFVLPTPTLIPPSATLIPSTATTIPPTALPIPPSSTPIPPSSTPIPPTTTPIPPTVSTTPISTAMPVPPTLTATPSSTAQTYARPVLLAPLENVTISQPTILEWSWNGTLQENEHFDVRVWQEGQQSIGIAWTKNTFYEFDPRIKANGNYFWSIVVIRGQNGQWQADLSEAAPSQRINISGSGGGVSSPTPQLLPRQALKE